MPRQQTPVQKSEFQRLRTFVGVLAETVFGDLSGLPPEAHPLAAADRLWKQSPSQALEGLRAAAFDMVEATQDLDASGMCPRSETITLMRRLAGL